MTVSIIIAVKELNDNLRECLKYCLNLDYPDFNIVVFPDRPFEFNHPKVKIIPTSNITPPKKRDLALREAKGQILAFIDDDAYPDRLWLNKAIRNFENEEIAAVCGPAVTPKEDSLRQKASGDVYGSILVSGFHSLRYQPKAKCYVDDYPSCNFIVRKNIFEQLGGFKVEFWPGEDTFLCLEITKKLNKRILYDPQVLVYHHRRALFIPHLKQVANYALHRGYFAKRFPQTSLRLAYFIPSLFLGFIVLGAPLAYLFSSLKILYFLGLIVYLVSVLICSICKELRLTFLRFFGIIFTHFVYGLFLLKGLFSKRLKEEI